MTVQHPEMPDPVSAERGDPHYTPWAHSIQVKLDGQVVKNCVAASATDGWVKVVVSDQDGNPVFHGDQLTTEIKRGDVELSWIEPGEHGMPGPCTPEATDA